ncbi:hypothetical protein DASC09_013200 [Saccharomycopsis crataegensis]|uniref:Pyridoxal phosphate homeostasis protein n=1 Tax=Saccharomycopsis crataegensis TaxID=43959 RepID=A0AAV5QHZ0_9ASCO|nr:hypothetical protein DASC09_013200 [Saccharomycopsis crataegensis]
MIKRVMEAAGKPLVKATAQRTQELVGNYDAIGAQVAEACKKYQRPQSQVRVLPVSKFKPANDILALYETKGLRNFGENYVQELVEKSQILPEDIQWHFIGNLQSNKVKHLATVKNLFVIESASGYSKMKKLNDLREESWPITNVYFQINTSDEAQKGGLSYDEVDKIVEEIKNINKSCAKLAFKGFMTIGSVGQSTKHDGSENTDFEKLVNLRKQVAEKLNIEENELDLSMGMSNDYEEAIRQGTNQVRIGTNIFGARDYSKKN